MLKVQLITKSQIKSTNMIILTIITYNQNHSKSKIKFELIFLYESSTHA